MHDWLSAWLAGVPEPTQAWLGAHPDATEVLDTYGEQGFDACADLISLTLPEPCLSGACLCTGGPSRS